MTMRPMEAAASTQLVMIRSNRRASSEAAYRPTIQTASRMARA